jgi:hypothetical protein
MDISHIYKFKADNVVSIVGGARCSLGKAVDIKHSREDCEETQKLKHCEAAHFKPNDTGIWQDIAKYND